MRAPKSLSPSLWLQDLKSPNILVDERWRVKISDFGLSTARYSTYLSSGKASGTPEWMAPEVCGVGGGSGVGGVKSILGQGDFGFDRQGEAWQAPLRYLVFVPQLTIDARHYQSF